MHRRHAQVDRLLGDVHGGVRDDARSFRLEGFSLDRALGVLRDDDELQSNNVLPRFFDGQHGLLDRYCVEGHSFADIEVLIEVPMALYPCSARRPKGNQLVAELHQHKDALKRRWKERQSREALPLI